MARKYRIRITDVTLCDGMHAVRHQFSVDDARAIASALDGSGVALIEAAHGDGLGGSSLRYGLAKEKEQSYLRAVFDAAQHTKVAALRPRMLRPIETDRASLTMEYAGVYSSFLLHAFRAAEQFQVDPRDVRGAREAKGRRRPRGYDCRCRVRDIQTSLLMR